MGIERLKGSLLSEAGNQAQRIVDEAEGKAEAMLEAERSRQAQARADAEKELEELLEDQRNEKLAWARLEAKRVRAEAEEDLIKASLDQVIDEMVAMRGGAEYKAFIKRAVEEGAAELGAGMTVHVLKGEKNLVPKLKSGKIAEDLQGLGGVLMESKEETVRVDFTLETMIETRRDDLRKAIHAKIFGGR